MKHLFAILAAIVFGAAVLPAQSEGDYRTVTSPTSGSWSSVSIWEKYEGGSWGAASVVPNNISSRVTISDGFTVTVDQDFTIGDLTIGSGASTCKLQTNSTTAVSMTINGDLTINALGTFTAVARTVPTVFLNNVYITGDITFGGTSFKCRNGSAGTTLGVINFTFQGSTDSYITWTGPYAGASGDFNAITMNKTGSAKLILNNDVFVSSGSGTNDATANSYLTLTNGIIVTGNNKFVHQSTTSATISGASSASYINGNLGRGMSSTKTTKTFDVGDSFGYRPIKVTSTTGNSTTSHYVLVKAIHGDANTGSSTVTSPLVKVAATRYYAISYAKGTSSVNGMYFSTFPISYGTDDGAVAGNSDLRVAYSTDSRATWTKAPMASPPTTAITTPPTYLTPDSLVGDANWIKLNDVSVGSGVMTAYVCLATENTSSNPLPVELVGFRANMIGKSVQLNWSTATETNNAGFEVEKQQNDAWLKIGYVEGHGTTNAPQSYSFVDAQAQGRVVYRLKQIDRDGAFTYSNSVEVTGAVVPAALSLQGNYPNPFNPTTTIGFTVPSNGEATLKIFNVLGTEVATVFHDMASAGVAYAVPFNAASLPSGTYFSRLEFGGQRIVKRMLLVK